MLCHGGAPIWTALTVKTGEITGISFSTGKVGPGPIRTLNSESFGSREALGEGVETGGRCPNAAACGQQTTRDWGGGSSHGAGARRFLQCAQRQVCQVSPAEYLHCASGPSAPGTTHRAPANKAMRRPAWLGHFRSEHGSVLRGQHRGRGGKCRASAVRAEFESQGGQEHV